MFRKLQERVAAAASAAFGSTSSETDLQRLLALGPFTTEQASSALRATSGDVDRAAELLLSQLHAPSYDSQASSYERHGHDGSGGGNTSDDADLQRALQQSLQDVAVSRPTRTPAMNDAARAAQQRATAHAATHATKKTKTPAKRSSPQTNATGSASSTTRHSAPVLPTPPVIRNNVHQLKQHHPDVKLIPKLQDKSLEEQILRTADRMKHHPAAVDTLHRAMTALFQNPDTDKYRHIDTTHAGFVRSVAPAPGALDFLTALKFAKDGRHLVLYSPLYDPALVYLGITALEQTRQTTEYQTAKALLVFTKEMTQLLHTVPTAAESARRTAQLAKCPTEPSTGQGALLQVQLLVDSSSPSSPPSSGNGSGSTGRTIRRRFDSDDTIADVLGWIGGTVGMDILERLTDGTWCLINVNHSQRAPIAMTQQHWTLQAVGCWPSGRLAVQPSSLYETNETSWVQRRGGDSHGLASGPSSDDE